MEASARATSRRNRGLVTSAFFLLRGQRHLLRDQYTKADRNCKESKLYFYYLLVLTYEINVLVFPNFYKCVCVYFVQPVYIHHTRSFECLLENLEST